jgi:hypothetical protein
MNVRKHIFTNLVNVKVFINQLPQCSQSLSSFRLLQCESLSSISISIPFPFSHPFVHSQSTYCVDLFFCHFYFQNVEYNSTRGSNLFSSADFFALRFRVFLRLVMTGEIFTSGLWCVIAFICEFAIQIRFHSFVEFLCSFGVAIVQFIHVDRINLTDRLTIR